MTDEQKEQLVEKLALETYDDTPLDYDTAKKVVLNAFNARDEEVEQLKKKVSALETVIVTARATISTQEAINKDLHNEIEQLKAKLAKAKNPWRDPKVELPNEGEIVLTKTHQTIDGGGEHLEDEMIQVQKYIGRWITDRAEQHRMSGILFDTISKVTAWMPIPKGGGE